MSKTLLGFIEVPSSIPVREPVMLVHGNDRIEFNEIHENDDNSVDLIMRYHPWSYVADGLELSEEAKSFLGIQ